MYVVWAEGSTTLRPLWPKYGLAEERRATGILGKSAEDIRQLRHEVGQMLTAEPGGTEDFSRLGKLAAFSGVCEFPNRVKCATLAWHTLDAALGTDQQIISTE